MNNSLKINACNHYLLEFINFAQQNKLKNLLQIIVVGKIKTGKTILILAKLIKIKQLVFTQVHVAVQKYYVLKDYNVLVDPVYKTYQNALTILIVVKINIVMIKRNVQKKNYVHKYLVKKIRFVLIKIVYRNVNLILIAKKINFAKINIVYK